jgi:hypothetical protein
MKERRRERHVQPGPSPGQAKKEETEREEPWITSFLQGALNDLHLTLQPSYRKSSLILTFSSKFTCQTN